jgi:hypothetical protein
MMMMMMMMIMMMIMMRTSEDIEYAKVLEMLNVLAA